MRQMLLAAAVAATAFGSVAANAATQHKHRHVRHLPQVATQPYAAPYAVPVQRGPRVGPAWSGPNQCWTDEGYGRYAPCDGGGKAM